MTDEAAKMQHVAYFDEGAFHWMSGIAPRDCELYAPWRSGAHEPAQSVESWAVENDLAMACLASLRAAIFLLEKGGKKAAPSDKMFAQMLVDYHRAADNFAASLAVTTAQPAESPEARGVPVHQFHAFAAAMLAQVDAAGGDMLTALRIAAEAGVAASTARPTERGAVEGRTPKQRAAAIKFNQFGVWWNGMTDHERKIATFEDAFLAGALAASTKDRNDG